MTRFSLFSFACILMVSAAASPALSQEIVKPQTCTIIPDAIVPLKPPTFGGNVEWRRVIGIEGEDRFSDIMALKDGGVVAVGESTPYSRTEGLKPTQLYLVRLDPAGKVLIEKRITVKGFQSVAGGVVLADRIVVASHLQNDKKESSVQLDFLDGAGNLKSSKIVADAERDIVPADIVVNADNATLTLAATTTKRGNAAETATVLYKISGDGSLISKREYLPGTQTRIEQLQRLPNGQIVGAGRIKTEEGRDAGWLLKVSRQGDLITQRPYARGEQAQFTRIMSDGYDGLYAVGESIPSDGSYRAAWVAHLNAVGDVIWQRFLSGKYRYGAVDLSVQKDGRLIVLMAGRPVEDGGREHARLITLTSTGDILQDEAFLEGSNALPVRLLDHAVTKRRFLAGYAQTGFADYGIPESQKLVTYDSWITGLPAPSAYSDPCRPKRTETLDDDQ